MQYYFSTKAKGTLADQIPTGYELYETVNGQVYLRRHEPRLISEAEARLIEEPLLRPRGNYRYKVEVRGKQITVYESSQDFSFINAWSMGHSPAALETMNERFANYQAVLRFTLIDPEQRHFAPERFCFRGSVDDWISIGPPDTLKKHALNT